jgi:uncharacterized sporulation protein YeaH/YhbH (DUF444 family)
MEDVLGEEVSVLQGYVLECQWVSLRDSIVRKLNERKENSMKHHDKPGTVDLGRLVPLVDVSGSMDEAKKEIAKRFFILLYLFLTKN